MLLLSCVVTAVSVAVRSDGVRDDCVVCGGVAVCDDAVRVGGYGGGAGGGRLSGGAGLHLPALRVLKHEKEMPVDSRE